MEKFDSTELKKTKSNLQRSEERYRLLYESMRDAFVIVEMNGLIVDANIAYCELTGYTIDELQRLTYVELTPSSWHELEAQIVTEQILPFRTSCVYEKEYRRKDGTIVPIELRTNLIVDDSGEPLQMWAIVRDISERKIIERSLKAADKRKDELLATVAHELLNPLTPIQCGLELLKLAREHTENFNQHSESFDQSIAMMERQVEQMVRLVGDLIDIHRISQGKIHLQFEFTSVFDVLNNAVETTRQIFTSKGHQLLMHSPPEPIYVYADPSRLLQIFTNLLQNAAKFTEQAGKIQIHVESSATAATITIEDNGIGISADMLSKVFDMFLQGDQAIDRSRPGLGIGLSLVKQLVYLHQGSIRAGKRWPWLWK